ncbi:MAG: hypothetical protein QXO84_01390 [Candidatus Aenigmatarchaeota archaeon]
MKKYFSLIFVILAMLHPVLAVTVSCGTPESPGNYRFYNRDFVPVRVFINTLGTPISASPNNFQLAPGASQLVEFRAPSNMAAQVLVTYADAVTNISASLQCYVYATSGSYSTTTTTTLQQGGDCSSYTTSSACRAAGCIWISIGISGYCTGSSSSPTTTTSTTYVSTSPTTTQLTTTTTLQQTSNCNGRSFATCNLIPGCEWVGSPTTGYCRTVATTTTTTLVLTTTTTTVEIIQNTPSSGTSGSSSSSSGSGWSSSSSSSSGKSTGFYDFPSFIQVQTGGEKTIKGSFYAAKDLNNVDFQVAGLDVNWFTITPSSVQTIRKGETVNLTVTIKVPENTKPESYVFKLVAKTGVNYEKSMTLAVTEKVITTLATTTTTIQQKQESTGFFARAGQLASNYWYLAAIPIVLLVSLAALPLISEKKKSKGSVYAFPEEEKDYAEDFVEIKIKEPEDEKQVELPVKPKRDIDEKIRKKVIKEIRERAMSNKKR